ncbi:hypothetical protein D4764_07G0006720 [Takifugu flavidus]|uniref:Uncharacterized protein n=1 Tax=Takifugu flavidus TaxID=433684 RepID=A0A5C6MSM6_9TELE|nr:hypothetical protein D4764_07G0006720 [Takifugu flavidus]
MKGDRYDGLDPQPVTVITGVRLTFRHPVLFRCSSGFLSNTGGITGPGETRPGGARPRDWLRSPGAGGGGWGALRASAAPRRVSQHSDQEELVEAEDDDEEEEERVTKFDPAASPAAGRLISMFEDVEEQKPRGEHGKGTPHRKYGVPRGPLAGLAPRRTPATRRYQF